MLSAILAILGLVAAAAAEAPLVPPGDTPDLTLLYTGGVVGYIEPCG